MNNIMKSNGFTMIEILIALIILTITFLSLAGLMVQTTKNNSFGGRMTEAATFAQDKLEELRASSWAAITPGSDKIDSDYTRGMDYTRNWNVATNGNLRTITVTINWADQTNHSVSFLSIISQ